MNYYPFHLGDYAAHTAHLEPMEDLAYRRMLDLYYRTEQPLPGEVDQIARLIRLRGSEREIMAVLTEFFQSSDAGWAHGRCDAEIARMRDKQAKARASAHVSASVRSTNAQRTLSERSTNVELPTPTPTPTPKKEPPNPRKRGQDDPPGFARFWAAWPASTRKAARLQCRKRWERAGLEEMAGRIVEAVESFKVSPDWTKDSGEFIPAPLLWLNQARWEAVEGMPEAPIVTASADAELVRQREQEAKAVPPPPEVLARIRGLKMVS